MSVRDIIQKAAEQKLSSGEEHFMGEMAPLAKLCGAETEDEVYNWMVELGNGLGQAGLTMMSGRGHPEQLWAVKGKRKKLNRGQQTLIFKEAWAGFKCSECSHTTWLRGGGKSECGNCKYWMPFDDTVQVQTAGECFKCSKVNWYKPSPKYNVVECWSCNTKSWITENKSGIERVSSVKGMETRKNLFRSDIARGF